jgi:hypothetical protein
MKLYLTGSVAARLVRLLNGAGGSFPESTVTNLSGIWRLNLERSDFGGGLAPRKIDVRVEHNEPCIQYAGALIDSEGASIQFEIEAVLDERLRSSNGVGTVISARIDANTTKSEWRSADGQRIETTMMRVSPDGRLLLVTRHVDGREGSFDCTETYEKQGALSVASVTTAPASDTHRALLGELNSSVTCGAGKVRDEGSPTLMADSATKLGNRLR